MKRILLTTFALAALATNALAADIPARVTKAPAAVVPICNWCGFYVGLNAGFAWADTDVGLGGALAPFGTIGVDTSGFSAGGQIGFNWQPAGSPLVLGIEADIQGVWGDETRTAVLVLPVLGATTVTSEGRLDYFGTVRGRIGYAWANWMAYFTGGWAYGGGTATVTASGVGFAASTSNSGSRNNGWTVGGGVEGKFAPNWSAKLEYLFVRFDGETNTIALTPAIAATVNTNDIDMHVVRAGINYHFAPLPR
jgi:outer membrane immunogenic protein